MLSIFEDKELNLWVGTFKGLNKFYDSRFITFTLEDGLPENRITSVTKDNKGNILVGTKNEGFVTFTGKNFKISTKNDFLPSKKISSIYFQFFNFLRCMKKAGTHGY